VEEIVSSGPRPGFIVTKGAKTNSSNWAADCLRKTRASVVLQLGQEEPATAYRQFGGASRETSCLRPSPQRQKQRRIRPPHSRAVAATRERSSRYVELERQRQNHCANALPRRGRRPPTPPPRWASEPHAAGRGRAAAKTSRGATWSATSQRSAAIRAGLPRSGLFSDRETLDQAPLDQAPLDRGLCGSGPWRSEVLANRRPSIGSQSEKASDRKAL